MNYAQIQGPVEVIVCSCLGARSGPIRDLGFLAVTWNLPLQHAFFGRSPSPHLFMGVQLNEVLDGIIVGVVFSTKLLVERLCKHRRA